MSTNFLFQKFIDKTKQSLALKHLKQTFLPKISIFTEGDGIDRIQATF